MQALITTKVAPNGQAWQNLRILDAAKSVLSDPTFARVETIRTTEEIA